MDEGIDHMTEKLPEDIQKDLRKTCTLHEHGISDYVKCREFSKSMSDLLARLEDAGCFHVADKVMSVLLDCSPKTGTKCDKSTVVSQITKKIGSLPSVKKE